MRRSVPLSAAVAALCAVTMLAQAKPAGKRVALLVGINQYHHSAFRASKLDFAEADVTELAAELRKGGYDEIVLLTGPRAKLAAIRGELDRLRKLPGDNGVLLVALAGHGIQPEASKDAYFCPYDLDLRVVPPNNPRPDEPWDYKTLLPLADVLGYLKASSAGTRVLLVDACRNDPAVRTRGFGTGIAIGDLPDNTAVFLSCSKGQRAYEDRAFGGGHGAFFYCVLEGLRGPAAEDGRVTADGLWRHIARNVPVRVAQVAGQGKEQKPYRLITGEVDLGLMVAVRKEPTRIPPPKAARPEATQVGTKPAPLTAPFSEAEAKRAQTAWARYLGKQVVETVDLGDGVAMEVVLIPPGTFQMGSPPEEESHQDDEARHEVTLSSPFYFARYPVTQQQWVRLTDRNPSSFAPVGDRKELVPRGLITAHFPVENILWADARAFCMKLGLRSRWRVDLPTEAEWEYACRAGTVTPFHFGRELNGRQANCNGTCPYGTTEKGPHLGRPCAIGYYVANAFGLCDMHGNVWQWCQDWYHDKYYQELTMIDPKGPATEQDLRVMRGGSWQDVASFCRAAYRGKGVPSRRSGDVGFRPAFHLD